MPATTFEEDLFRDPGLPPDRARAMLAELLESGGDDAAATAYRALRGWVWGALGARLRGADLAGWHDLFRAVSRRLEKLDPALASKLRGFGELVSMSLGYWAANPAEEVLERTHVPEILAMIAKAPGGALPRAEIRRRLGISDPNMSRVILLMVQAGLVERERKGKAAHLRLTAEGERRYAALRGAEKPVPEATPRPDERAVPPADAFRPAHEDARRVTPAFGAGAAPIVLDVRDGRLAGCPFLSEIANVSAFHAASNLDYLVASGALPTALVTTDRAGTRTMASASLRWAYTGIARREDVESFVPERHLVKTSMQRRGFIPKARGATSRSARHGW